MKIGIGRKGGITTVPGKFCYAGNTLAKKYTYELRETQVEFGAVEWIRTTTVLLPPAPQAGASASSATTAR